MISSLSEAVVLKVTHLTDSYSICTVDDIASYIATVYIKNTVYFLPSKLRTCTICVSPPVPNCMFTIHI